MVKFSDENYLEINRAFSLVQTSSLCTEMYISGCKNIIFINHPFLFFAIIVIKIHTLFPFSKITSHKESIKTQMLMRKYSKNIENLLCKFFLELKRRKKFQMMNLLEIISYLFIFFGFHLIRFQCLVECNVRISLETFLVGWLIKRKKHTEGLGKCLRPLSNFSIKSYEVFFWWFGYFKINKSSDDCRAMSLLLFILMEIPQQSLSHR